MTNSIGSRQPPLVGTSWKMCFNATKEAAIVVARETLSGPGAGRRRAREVQRQRFPVDREVERDLERFVAAAVVVDMVLEGIGPVGQLGNQGPHLPARAARNLLHRGGDGVVAEAVEQVVQARRAEVERAQLGVEIAVIAPGQPPVGEQDVDDVPVDRAAVGELHRRDAHPLLHDVAGRGVVVSRHVAADIEPVAHRGEVAEQFSVPEYRLDDLDVVEVGRADIGVVQEVQVAVLRSAVGVGALRSPPWWRSSSPR